MRLGCAILPVVGDAVLAQVGYPENPIPLN